MTGVAHEQTGDHEDRAVTQASHPNDCEVGEQLPGEVRQGSAAEVDVQRAETHDRDDTEYDRNADPRGGEFPSHKDVAPDRRQEVVVQAPIEDLSAKQVHENPDDREVQR